ncbi:NAD(P)H-dependent oxidoreductase [Clostridium formicaceticum]|uniref:FMN reductase n=1 Tax=Clostridium formicaceticum TaxID=1497 RepID=A0AAC9WFD8_9CLOT|nr:NAD(P)H-dependent oxidoreductase [Clostridium formicaceticum]AOY76423.1 FMN reductase [Clostridium formicaceticum]ARE86817.1 NADPH-dependent FMN reductase [Clostridium formicaceticum]
MIYLIIPGEVSEQLSNMAEAATKGMQVKLIREHQDLPNLAKKKILFAVELDKSGINIPLFKILSSLHHRGCDALANTSAALLVHSATELYTKNIAKSIVFKTNQLGCSFMGHPLVEATATLNNFLTWQKSLKKSLETIALELSFTLGQRLINYKPTLIKKPKILALHASSKSTSNTLMLWHMVKEHLTDCEIEEFHVENGTVLDCVGCPYNTCMHFGLNSSCFYGGIMIKEILPAIEKSDAILWICPNYNDAISANLMAVVNRLTALYRKISFYDKTIFAIIVSGNSGGDVVAEQLIDALTINKGFRLPPNFAMIETANDPKAILKVEDIESKAMRFAMHVLSNIKTYD